MARPVARLVAAALVLPALVAGCTVGGDSGPATSSTAAGPASTTGPAVPFPGLEAGAWTRLAESPLSPRERPVVAVVGGELVVVGGHGGRPCPDGALCGVDPRDMRRDGAVYDPATGAWRRIAPAPRRIPWGAPHAVVGDRLFVHADPVLLVWDVPSDRWQELAGPRPLGNSTLVADGASLVVASRSDEAGERPDRVLDTTTGDWSRLPDDPLGPTFERTITPTPHGLVLTAWPVPSTGPAAGPALLQAALLPPGAERWRRLPGGRQAFAGGRWTWTGRRLVDPSLGRTGGGRPRPADRTYPFGGRLDPLIGRWEPLQRAPEQGTGGWPVEVSGGRLGVGEGWLLDDATGTWTRVPRPDGAPREPGTATWLGEVLVVHGGADWGDDVPPSGMGAAGVLTTSTWAYLPEAAVPE